MIENLNFINELRTVFVDELISFSNWIGYEEDTAYVFCFHDVKGSLT